MRLILGTLVAAVLFACPIAGAAQEVAPIFEQAPMVQYETYRGVDQPVFGEYFEMLVNKYKGSQGHGWGLYRENSTVWYRITPLPNRMESLVEVQQARNAGAQAFSAAERELWNTAWGTRHLALYTAAPAMSVVPDGFSVADIQALPYNRVTIYHLKWDQAAAFRQALRDRSALDREANIENFVLTAWNGGLGTEAQTVMIRVSAESIEADIGPNREARRQAREPYMDEWGRLSQIMTGATAHMERHDQIRIADLSNSPGN